MTVASQGLIHVIYHSVAVNPFTAQELASLIDHARMANSRRGVSGALLHDEGSFLQVIEGPEAVVDDLMQRIAADGRHTQITIIIREPITARAFGEWPMGLARVGEDEWLDGASGEADTPPGERTLRRVDAGRARNLLRAFSQGHWRSRLMTAFGEEYVQRSNDEPALPKAAVVWPAFSYAFQPIVDGRARTVVAYEALVRGPRNEAAWAVIKQMHPEALREFDRNARPLAIGLAAALKLSCRLHLNVLPDTLDLDEVGALVRDAYAAGLQASQIVLEVSESTPIGQLSDFVRRAQACRRLGVHFAIDDFGSGHSGLTLLAEFQPEMVKLDVRLIRGIASHGPRQAIARGVLRTCEDLGIDVIAEGVETQKDHRWLRDAGVRYFQGYLFARPGFEALPKAVFLESEASQGSEGSRVPAPAA